MKENNFQSFTTKAVPARYEGKVEEITLVYETYGQLNKLRDNAILIVHGFSASSHVTCHHIGDEDGWWNWAVGPGRPLDSTRYFIVCANNIGSCFGSSGPTTLNKLTGEPFAAAFPFPTVADIVFCQHELQMELGIGCWKAVVGGSLGGMATLQWAKDYPSQVETVVCLNAGARLSHVGQGLMELQADLIAQDGDKGLLLARRLATLSYLDENYFHHLTQGDTQWCLTEWIKAEADAFSKRFNPFSYLGFLHAMREFDCYPSPASIRPRIIFIGCAEDKLFPSAIIQETVSRFALGTESRVLIVNSIYGHDAFLMDEPLYAPLLSDIFGVSAG
ncbi:MAG: alpha/beta fold hydrolase [Negativicutes bacterium]